MVGLYVDGHHFDSEEKRKLLSQPKIDWQVYPPRISTISFFSYGVCVCWVRLFEWHW